MSLSIPTTSMPFSCRNRAVSLPISPPEPVTIATGIPPPLSSSRPGRQTPQRALVGPNPLDYIGHDLANRSRRPPAERLTRPRAVRNVERHVDPGGLRVGSDRHLAQELTAELRELAQRDRVLRSPTHVEHLSRMSLDFRKLTRNELEEVGRMEEVANLLCLTAEARVAQRSPEKVIHHPEREHSLVHLAELPGSGDDSAAVDDRFQPVGSNVLPGDHLGGELTRAVEGAGTVHRKPFRDSRRAHAPDVLLVRDREPRVGLVQPDPLQLRNRVDARRREQEKSTASPPRELEAVDRAMKVRLQNVARRVGEPGEHARLCRGVHYEVEIAREVLHIGGISDVAVHELDPLSAKDRQVRFAPAPSKV